MSTRERRTTSSEDASKPKPQYRAPRLGESYQCYVPPVEGSRANPRQEKRRGKKSPQAAAAALAEEIAADLRQNQFGLKDTLIWSPHGPKANEVDEFLLYARGITEQASHDPDARDLTNAWRLPSGDLIPLECDEQALHYFFAQKANLPMAKLRLASDLGMKKEHKFLHALDTMYQQGASAVALDKRDRSRLVGAYAAGLQAQREGYSARTPAPYPYRLPVFHSPEVPNGGLSTDPTSTDGLAERAAGLSAATPGLLLPSNASGASSTCSMVVVEDDAKVEDVSTGSGMDRKKRATADKAEIRKLWQNVQERAVMMVANVQVSRKSIKTAERPKLLSLLAIIKEANELPRMDLPPGDTTYKDLEEEIMALKQAIANVRPQLAMVHDAFNTTAPEGAATVDTLKEVLKSLRTNIIELPEEATLVKVIKQAEQWQSAAESLLANAHRQSFLKALDLMKQAESIPFSCIQKDILQEKLDEIEDLKVEINDLRTPLLPVVTSNRGRMVVTEPKPHNIETLRDLRRRVETVGLRFPEGQALQEMLVKAEKWLTEAEASLSANPDLKRLTALLEESGALPVDVTEVCEQLQVKVDQANKWVDKVRKALPKKKTRGNTGEIIKVDYTAARTLLSEGNEMGVEVKELEDMANALDTAETWLQRVREALEDSTDEASLDALQALLGEADAIPVVMEEHRILASEIEIRKWGLRVQPRLDVAKITASELEVILAEAAELRSRLPLSPKEQRSWRLPQEAQAKSLLDQSNQWMTRYKRCLNPSGSCLRRNVGLDKLLPLIDDGKKLSVDLSEFIGPLSEAVAAAERWYIDSLPLLKACRVTMKSRAAALAAAAARPSPPPTDPAAGDAMDVEQGEKKEKGEPEKEEDDTPTKVLLSDVMACVASAEGATLSIDLPEVEQLRTLVQRVNQWVEKLQGACPTRLSKRRSRAKATVSEIRKLVEQGAKFPVDVTEEVAKIRERLEETTQWQKRVGCDLQELATAAGEDVDRFDEFMAERNAQREEKRRMCEAEGRSYDPEDDEDEQEFEQNEERLKLLSEMVDEAGDIAIETKEEKMVQRHLRAHKWFAQCTDLLQYIDPQGLIPDGTIRDIKKLVDQGKDLMEMDEEEVEEEVPEEEDEEGMIKRENGDLDNGEDEEPIQVEEVKPAPVYARRTHALPAPRHRKKTAEEVLREMSKSKDRRRRKLEEIESSSRADEASKGNDNGSDEEEEEEEEDDAMDLDSSIAGASDSLGLRDVMEAVEGVGQGDDKPQCDLALITVMERWWTRIEPLREVVDRSVGWLARATRAAGPGADKVAIETLENLVAEAKEWSFELEYGRKLEAELQRAHNIQSRALSALGENPLTLTALKSLIGEGDKCRVFFEEIRTLKRHLMAGQRWLNRFQKARPEDLEEMMTLARDAEEIQADLNQELRSVRRVTDRCCLCRKTRASAAHMITCAECHEQYHMRCLDVNESMAESWRKRGWRCARCLVRWHLKDSLEKATSTLARYLSSPPPSSSPTPGGDSLLAHESLTYALSPEPGTAAVPTPSEGGAGGQPRLPGTPGVAGLSKNMRVTAWMKRLLAAFRQCAENGSRELKILGHAKKVKGSVLVEVIRLAKMDPEVDASLDVREVIWNLSVVFWGARLVCQLRKRPNLVDLQALTKEMPSVGIINEPLHHMLSQLITRSVEWIHKTKPVLREAWVRQDLPVDLDRLRMLLREKSHVPVRLCLERRIEAMMSEECPDKRYCNCRGFYDGLFMIQCVSCNEWYHGRCVQVRAEDLDKRTEYVCEGCSHRLHKAYHWPPYMPPNIDAALVERPDELEDLEDEEMIADRKCLDGIWPSLERLAALDRSSAHLDAAIYGAAVAKYPSKLKPVPGRLALPGARPDPMIGPYSSMHMPPKGIPAGPMLMGSASPLPNMSLPKKPKPTKSPGSLDDGGLDPSSSMLPQRQSSRPPKPVQPNPNYDYDLELPPAHKLPPRPKSYGSGSELDMMQGDDNSVSEGDGSVLGKRARKPKSSDDYVFEARPSMGFKVTR